jgi:hypothetical protein
VRAHIVVTILAAMSSLVLFAGSSTKNDSSRRAPEVRVALRDGRDEAGPEGNEQRMEDLEISENALSRNETEVHAVAAPGDVERQRAGTVAACGQDVALPPRSERG